MSRKKLCASCVYRGVFSSGGGVFCDYFGITGKLRMNLCECFGPGEGCELYEPDAGRRNRRVGLSLEKEGNSRETNRRI